MTSLGEKRRSITEIENLDDHSLVEILCRLPICAIYQCKTISKRWLSLISSSYFEKRYCTLHDPGDNIVLLATIIEDLTDYAIILKDRVIATSKSFSSEVARNKVVEFSWDFSANNQLLKPCNILFVAGDLVLIESNLHPVRLILYNVLTKQCKSLRSTPPHSHNDFRGCLRNKDNPKQYKVVLVQPRIHSNGASEMCLFLEIFIFSSENGEWSKFSILSPSNIVFKAIKWIDRGQNATTCNGMLFWTYNMIVGYDPFNKPNECEFIEFPYQSGINMDYACITNAQGCIRLYDQRVTSASTITLWVLNDYTNRVWSKKYIDISGICWHQISSEQTLSLSIKGFNPNDGDVLYALLSKNLLLAINLTSETDQTIADLKPTSVQVIFDFRPNSEFLSRLLPLVPPSWPMPL